MPELPEVETVVRDLRPALAGRRVTDVEHGDKRLRHPWDPSWDGKIKGRNIGTVGRLAKWIAICFNPGGTLLVHLGMTGQLTVQPSCSPLADHVHLRFLMDGGLDMRFRDIRRFGGAEYLAEGRSWTERLLESGLGPEPWDMPEDIWIQKINKSSRPVKSILLDQKTVSGIGNIYADEALYCAGIHPQTPGKSLKKAEAVGLLLSARTVLEEAIEGRGTTLRDYVGGSGLKGSHQFRLAVYGREGEPCLSCGENVQRILISGRSSHYCPQCQPVATRKRGGNRVIP